MTATQLTLDTGDAYLSAIEAGKQGRCWWCGEPVEGYVPDAPGGISTPPSCGCRERELADRARARGQE